MVRDSGLTNSRFMKVQKHIQDEHTKYIEEKSKDAEIEKMKNRFDTGAKPLADKRGLWDMVKDLFQ